MAIRDIFKINRKTFFNPSVWIDYDWLRFQNRTIWGIVSSLFVTAQPAREETFENAMIRLNLTEEDVRHAVTYYRLYAFGFLLLGLLVFVYAFFLLFHHGSLQGWILGFAAAAVFCAQAFKYDFWAFQMKQRKLGQTFAEWKRHLLG